MERQENAAAPNSAGHFLYNKSVFLLTSSVGKATAETLVTQATTRIGRSIAMLATTDIVRLAATIEPDLATLVGIEKAKRLAAALRVMVGGRVGV